MKMLQKQRLQVKPRWFPFNKKGNSTRFNSQLSEKSGKKRRG